MEKIIVGIDECYVIEKKTISLAFGGCGSNTYILGKRTRYPFPNKPYFTIYRDDDNGGLYSGHYDMNLKDALKDFEKRTNPDYLKEKEKESIPSEDFIMHPEDTALEEGLDDFERMEYEYNLIQWEKQHSY
jgi:hypothetical protein